MKFLFVLFNLISVAVLMGFVTTDGRDVFAVIIAWTIISIILLLSNAMLFIIYKSLRKKTSKI